MELAGRKIAAYCRVSTAEQRRGKTIDIQRVSCEEYVKQEGGEITEYYLDNGFSGASPNRPGWNRLIHDLENYDAVVVYHPDRLSRDAGDVPLVKVARQIWKHADLWIVGLGKLPPGEHSEMMLNMVGTMSHSERQRIITRSKAGKLHKAKERKKFVGHIARYGYKYTPKYQHPDSGEMIEGELKIIPEEAKHVRRMYEIILNGGTLGEIVREMDKKKVPPPGTKRKGGSNHWYRQVIWNILTDHIYYGIYNYGRLKVITEAGERVKVVKRDQKDWTPVALPKELHIVTKDEFDRVQKQLQQNRSNGKNKAKHFYLLSGKVICGHCGMTWSGAGHQGYSYYRCNNVINRYPKPAYCRGSIRSSTVDDAVWREIKGFLDKPDMVIEMMKEANSKIKREFAYERRMYEDKERRLRQLILAEGRVKQAYRQGVYTIDELKAELKKIRDEQDNMDEIVKPEPGLYDPDEKQLKNWIADVKEQAEMDFSFRKQLAQQIVEKVIIHRKQRLEITLAVPLVQSSQLLAFPPYQLPVSRAD